MLKEQNKDITIYWRSYASLHWYPLFVLTLTTKNAFTYNTKTGHFGILTVT